MKFTLKSKVISITQNIFKIMKNVFYFVFKAALVREILKFLSWLFCYVKKQLHKVAKIKFKYYGIKLGSK